MIYFTAIRFLEVHAHFTFFSGLLRLAIYGDGIILFGGAGYAGGLLSVGRWPGSPQLCQVPCCQSSTLHQVSKGKGAVMLNTFSKHITIARSPVK